MRLPNSEMDVPRDQKEQELRRELATLLADILVEDCKENPNVRRITANSPRGRDSSLLEAARTT